MFMKKDKKMIHGGMGRREEKLMGKIKGQERNSINKMRYLNLQCELEFTSNSSELTWASFRNKSNI